MVEFRSGAASHTFGDVYDSHVAISVYDGGSGGQQETLMVCSIRVLRTVLFARPRSSSPGLNSTILAVPVPREPPGERVAHRTRTVCGDNKPERERERKKERKKEAQSGDQVFSALHTP